MLEYIYIFFFIRSSSLLPKTSHSF